MTQPTLNWFSEEKNYARKQAQKALDAYKKTIGKTRCYKVTNEPPTWIELPIGMSKENVAKRKEMMKETILRNQFVSIYK